MNIAFVNWWTFNTVMGGIEAVGARVARALTARGHHVCLAAVEEGYPSVEGFENLLLPDKQRIRSRANFDALVEYFGAHGVEVIVCHNAYRRRLALLLAEVADRLGARLVFEIHTDPTMYKFKRRTPPFLHRAEYLFRRHKALRQWRLISRVGDAIVLLSPSYVPIFRDLVGDASEGKLISISNPNTYDPTDIPAHLSKEKMLLYVGRFDYGQKRTDRLIGVWGMIQDHFPDWSLYIVGGGNERVERDLRRRAETLRLERIHFEGVRSPQPYLSRAGILVSSSSYEGLPLVILEALQYGVVPIAFDSYAALSDVTDGGRLGVMVPPFDLRAYADSLSRLMEDDAGRAEMSQAGREWSHRYDMDEIAGEWERFLTQLLSK